MVNVSTSNEGTSSNTGKRDPGKRYHYRYNRSVRIPKNNAVSEKLYKISNSSQLLIEE